MPLFFIPFVIACNKTDSTTKIVDGEEFSVSRIRSIDDALRWAERSRDFLNYGTKSGSKVGEIESCSVVTRELTKGDSSQVDTVLYVFNFLENSGFSIISASSFLQPIVAVTESGSYTVGESTGNAAFDDYVDNVIVSLPRQIPEIELYSWYDYEMEGDSCSRRVNVNWGQVGEDFYENGVCLSEGFYGRYCPNSHAGCVPVAIAQAMTYHMEPQAFVSTCNMGDDFIVGDSISLDWNHINLHQKDHSDILECNSYHNQISALLREIGNRLNCDYSNSSQTGTNNDNIEAAVESFGYDCSDKMDFYISRAKSAIRDNGPILISAIDSENESGHTWVVDAYQDFRYSYCKYEMCEDNGGIPVVTQRQVIDEAHMFHFNWGYDGSCNGWFAFNVYDTTAALTYDNTNNASTHNYTGFVLKMWSFGY